MRRSDSLAIRTLLGVARHRQGSDAELCRLVFEHIDTTAVLHAGIQRALSPFRLSELQFGVILMLHALDPERATAADLAVHTAVSRSAMTDALDHLERLRLVSRTRDEHDRRILQIALTSQGRTTAEPATRSLLQSLTAITRYIDATTRSNLIGGYALLRAGATPVPA